MGRQDHPAFGGVRVDELTRARSVATAKQRRLQRVLRQLDQPLAAVAAPDDAPAEATVELCHLTRQHLTTIGALTAALEMSEGSVRPEFLAAIREEVEHLEDVCGRVGGTSKRRVQTLRLDALTTETVSSASFRSVSEISETTEAVRIRADEIDVRTVLDALVGRACAAAGPHGSVDISVGHRGDLAVVTVWSSSAAPVAKEADVALRMARRLAALDQGAVAVMDVPDGSGELVELSFPAIVLRIV